ncbi:nose resistant to fluoxetine protein 6-like [Tribolium madens]|uniref:nose resistant to fluoxetine protein 6-like n=1 Tax=Tribolium madens TaxID=41895 RepID=UPI001CF76586|nr:nose resistant to fluoxetine protein 6-like [Tribolium madens]
MTLYIYLYFYCNFLIISVNSVKLTMKQGLLMNQVLATYALDNAQNSLCKNHSNLYRNGLRSFESWALNMFDSSSKIQPGILLGNLVEFGSYKQCIQIRFDEIKGKHCLIKITPNLNLIKKILSFRNVTEKRFPKIKLIVEKSAFFWSVCVPDSCPTNDILRHFKKIISEMTEGLNLNASLDEHHCLSEEDSLTMGLAQYVSLAILLIFIGVSLISTILDAVMSKNSLISAFSITSNYQKIVSRRRPNDLDCIHGLRFLSTCYVIIGHRYLMAMFSPVINGLEILDWILNYSSTIIIGGTICVDTFFMISGLLVSISFFEHVTKNGTFNVLTFYLYRYFRITPPLAIVVLIYATLIQFLGSGPLWYDTCMAHLEPCKYYWWSTLLHIQSYTNPHALCILQTWSLTCDMIFFYFSPILLYPLWKNRIFGLIVCVSLYILSVAISFYFAWINEYEGGMPITNQLFETKYFQQHYITPHTRAPPYILGVLYGFYLFTLKEKKIKMNFFTILSGWLVAATLMTVSVVGNYSFQMENHDFNRLEASLFLSCSRSAWTFGVIWIIWSCVNGYGGIINDFLSAFAFRVLGRISYGCFLLHLILQLFKNGANKMPIYFSNFSTIYDSCADLLLVVLVSFFFTMFYELPLLNIASLFFKIPKKVQSNN